MRKRVPEKRCITAATTILCRAVLSAVVCLVVVPLSGCGQRTVPVSDVDQATALITQTFDDWKAGATLEAQLAKSPPVYVAEDLWQNGAKLKSYQLTRPGEVFGTNIRFHVQLKCTDRAGATKDRNLKYLVTTTPELTIARDDR